MRDVSFSTSKPGERSAVVRYDAKSLRVEGLACSSIASPQPLARLVNTRDAWIPSASAPEGIQVLVEVTGEQSRDCLLLGATSMGRQACSYSR